MRPEDLDAVEPPAEVQAIASDPAGGAVALLHKKRLLHSPWNVFDVAPFVVNSAFSMELYLKTLARSHRAVLNGHDLLKLLDSLPAAAHNDISAVLPACRSQFRPEGDPDFRTCIAGLSNAFVEWRYPYEKTRATGIRIDRAIFVTKVMHEACRRAVGLVDAGNGHVRKGRL
jgi:hypothetical protein